MEQLLPLPGKCVSDLRLPTAGPLSPSRPPDFCVYTEPPREVKIEHWFYFLLGIFTSQWVPKEWGWGGALNEDPKHKDMVEQKVKPSKFRSHLHQLNIHSMLGVWNGDTLTTTHHPQ